jgi:hypothetical protein
MHVVSDPGVNHERSITRSFWTTNSFLRQPASPPQNNQRAIAVFLATINPAKANPTLVRLAIPNLFRRQSKSHWLAPPKNINPLRTPVESHLAWRHTLQY